MKQSVGVLGLGIMGSAISRNLLEAGIEVVGYDVLPEKVAELEARGGRSVASAGEVARAASVIITVLPYTHAVTDAAAEVAEAGSPDTVFIECSTMPLETKFKARDILAAKGLAALDCPLSGTGAQALTKDLAVYASGEPELYQRCIPVFEGFARAHYLVGEYGAGTKMKYVANLLVAIHNVSAGEAFVLGMKAGLDPAMILEVVGDGAGSSRMFEVRGPLIVNDEYEPATMKVEVWQKDMTIIGEFARELQVATPLFAAAAQVYNSAMAQGLAKKDTAAVCSVLERMAGFQRPKQ